MAKQSSPSDPRTTTVDPGMIDLAFWNPAGTSSQFESFCTGAINTRARAVCVPSGRVIHAVARLEDSAVKVVALTGFPLGNSDSDVKRFEAESAIDNGAQEIELVLGIGRILEGDSRGLLREMRDVVECADERHVIVSLESNRINSEQILSLCALILDAGAVGISMATGFSPGIQADVEIIRKIREATSPRFIIKVPVSNEIEAASLLAAGANRIGMVVEPAAI